MEKVCKYKNGTIAYGMEGNGPVVMLIHGFGEDASIWNNQVQYLQSNYTVITPFIPGTGKSTLLQSENDNPIEIKDYAIALHAIVEAENITSLVMLGHSLGGYITLAFAEIYPSLLKGFGLVHSTAFADSEEKKANRLKGIRIMQDYGAFAFIKTTIPNLFGANFKAAFPEKVDLLIAQANVFNTTVCQQYYEAMRIRPDRTNVLKNAGCPVLFNIGTEDIAAPINDVLQQSHLPACSYVNILENVGHMGMLEATNQVNEYFQEFLKAVYS
jgi:pimeloyl-ACP methyl ester carboxylesterase